LNDMRKAADFEQQALEWLARAEDQRRLARNTADPAMKARHKKLADSYAALAENSRKLATLVKRRK